MTDAHGLLDAILRTDFLAFATKAFGTLKPSITFEQNWHHQAMAYQLGLAAEGKILRLIITLPPRGLKSAFASIALPAFVLGHDPSRKIICVSYSADLARQFAIGTRDVMDAKWYQTLFPGTRFRRGNAADADFTTTKRGGRFSTSVGGTLTGRGGNLIIIDDPIKADEIYSDTRREHVIRWFRETLITRLDDKRTDVIILIMQRLHVEDLAGVLLEDGGWVHLNLPAIAQKDEAISIGPGKYYERKAGVLLHPERDSAAVLADLRKSVGERAFQAQYLQEPVPPDGTIWHLGWFRRYDAPIELEPNDEIIQSWDTAQKSGLTNDYSVCTTWLVREDKSLFLLDVFRARLEFPDLRRKIVAHATEWKARYVCIEDASSGQSLLQDLERNSSLPSRCYLQRIKPVMDKLARAEAASVAIEAGRVYLPNVAGWLPELTKEIRNFPRGNDDQVDSISQLINFVENRIVYATHIRVSWPT